MAQNKKRWRWALFLISLLCLILYFYLSRDHRQVNDSSTKDGRQIAAAPQRLPSAKPVIAPGYLSLSAWKIPESRNPAESMECLMTGKVKSDEDQPLPGATVSLYPSGPADPDFEWPNPLLTEVCDYEGRYTIHMTAPLAKAAIGVRKDGYATLQDTQDIEVPGTITKDYILRTAGACLEGVVLEGEKPIPKTRVFTTFPRVASRTDRSITSAVSASSDERGRYSLQGLAAGLLDVFADPPGYQRKMVTITVPSGPCGHLDFKVAPGTLISFVVKDTRGQPIQGAFAMTRGETGQFGRGTRTIKDEQGNIESILPPFGHSDSHGKMVFHVPANFTVFDCRVGATDYQPVTISIDKNNPPAQVVLEDLEGSKHQISGIVLSETGNSVSGARVTVFQTRRTVSTTPAGLQPPSSTDRAWPEARTDAIGRFSVPLLLPDVTEVRVLKEGFKEERMVFESGQSAGFLEIRLEHGNTGIFGKVTNAEGKPVTHFTVILYDAVSTTSRSYSRDIENEEGRFWVIDVPTGTYDVLIQAPTTNSVQNTKFKGVELKSGYLFGEIDAQLTELVVGKK